MTAPPPDTPHEYICIHGHDRCDQMLPGPNCPYCEKRPRDTAAERAREILGKLWPPLDELAVVEGLAAALRAEAGKVRQVALIEMTVECDRVKTLFPGYEKHGTYDPSDAKNVYEMACDRLRAHICALAASPLGTSDTRPPIRGIATAPLAPQKETTTTPAVTRRG